MSERVETTEDVRQVYGGRGLNSPPTESRSSSPIGLTDEQKTAPIVGQCRYGGSNIPEGQPEAWCTECGESLPKELADKLPNNYTRASAPPKQTGANKQESVLDKWAPAAIVVLVGGVPIAIVKLGLIVPAIAYGGMTVGGIMAFIGLLKNKAELIGGGALIIVAAKAFGHWAGGSWHVHFGSGVRVESYPHTLRRRRCFAPSAENPTEAEAVSA